MKPLSRERLEEIVSHSKCLYGKPLADVMIRDLLAAEAYWREAVKKAAISEHDGECFDGACPFCRVNRYGGEAHKPDCSWLLAQD